jgi:hypothetical protein
LAIGREAASARRFFGDAALAKTRHSLSDMGARVAEVRYGT